MSLSFRMMRCRAILWPVLGLVLPAAWAAPAGAEPRRPNIVLLTLESMRTDHVGCYGYGRPTTPVLDALAGEGVLFENAYTVSSWTLPSHASLFTGLYPAAHGAISFDTPLDESHVTLAEALSGAGYQTAGFISGPLLLPKYRLDQGFATYDASSSQLIPASAHNAVTNRKMEKLLAGFVQEGINRDGRPFFLFAYLWDPHYDYLPPPPFNTEFVPDGAVPVRMLQYAVDDVVNSSTPPAQLAYVVSQYDGEIRWTDQLLGRLFEQLRRRGLWDETAIIVTSDHGEEFFEHGAKGHKNNLHEESVHVPLVIKLPGRSQPRRDDRLVSLVDLYPTILEMAGAPPGSLHHGRSLLGPAPAKAEPIFFELQSPGRPEGEDEGGTILAVRDGSAKLIVDSRGPSRACYDLAADPGESRPLDQPAAGKLDRLDRLLSAHIEAMRRDAQRRRQPPPLELSPEEMERLRSLGYVGGGD